jgi:hypothetical protein
MGVFRVLFQSLFGNSKGVMVKRPALRYPGRYTLAYNLAGKEEP